MITGYDHLHQKLHDGISAQYGRPVGAINDTDRGIVLDNFTVYNNGEVQIRGWSGESSSTVILEKNAFIVLMNLFAQGTDSVYLLTPSHSAGMLAQDAADKVHEFMNSLLLKNVPLNYLTRI